MHLKWIQSGVLSLLLLVSLSACSGNGDTPQPSPAPLPAASAEGFWTGTTDTNRTIAGLVLDDGVYWVLYSAVGDPSVVAGLIQGDSSSQNGVFTSSNARDFNLEGQPIRNATINGNYAIKQNLNGTLVYQTGGQSTFTTTYNSAYELTPDMNAVAGTYTGEVAANETATVVLTSNGGISGSSSTGCTFTGSFSPRTHGNVFNITVTFGGQAACSNGADTLTGIGTYDAGTKTLTSAALNSTRTNGFIFIGTKP
ncbi:MAG: hypothetical protein H8K03_01325 [Nitrospira sp.]|jgi:hypothetical protein|nr:hypothetical protein [Nitrospira sp. BO4]